MRFDDLKLLSDSEGGQISRYNINDHIEERIKKMMSLATHFSRSSCPPMAYSLPFNAHAARKDLGWFKSPTLSHLYVNMVILRKNIKLAFILTIHLRPSII